MITVAILVLVVLTFADPTPPPGDAAWEHVRRLGEYRGIV